MAGFAWILYTIFFGDETYRRLVVKLLLLVGAIALSAEAIKHADEEEWCVAALLSVFALLTALAAVFAL